MNVSCARGGDRCSEFDTCISTGTPACTLTLHGHAFAVLDIALSQNEQLLFSASWDHTLRVWALDRGGELLFTANGGSASPADDGTAVWALALSTDASELHAAASDGCVRAFCVATPGGPLSGLGMNCSLRGGVSSLFNWAGLLFGRQQSIGI